MPIAVGILAIVSELREKNAKAAREAQRLATANAEESIKKRLEEQDLAAERAAREVKDKLDIATADTMLKLEVIRIEGNSKMGAQKKEAMEAWQAAAKFSKDPEHEAKARQAEKIYFDHQAAQQLADEQVRLFVESQRLKLLRLPPDAQHKF